MKIFALLKKDIMQFVDYSAMQLYDYANDFIYNAYSKECPLFWPIKDETGNPLLDLDTGKPYSDKFNPEQLAYMLSNSINRGDGESRIVKIWVDTEGREDGEKWQRIGRLVEVYECKPWGRLKSKTASEIAAIIKKK